MSARSAKRGHICFITGKRNSDSISASLTATVGRLLSWLLALMPQFRAAAVAYSWPEWWIVYVVVAWCRAARQNTFASGVRPEAFLAASFVRSSAPTGLRSCGREPMTAALPPADRLAVAWCVPAPDRSNVGTPRAETADLGKSNSSAPSACTSENESHDEYLPHARTNAWWINPNDRTQVRAILQHRHYLFIKFACQCTRPKTTAGDYGFLRWKPSIQIESSNRYRG